MFSSLKEEIAPGKNKISSRSKRTNKMAKKKNGVLRERLEERLSNPDSKTPSLSLFKKSFLERNTWIKSTPTNNNNIRTLIVIIIS